ncbi:hypothetical protein PAPYR_10919 [Paratrimastix pyriformis]|uniref:Proteasome assembly chaperone 3 n=1 Tax=Paratrimastix pyriformis TaxID=342808 RepID=A0ABQ8U4W7_9EUKA|nr:hypothetical protein PAPYR_10919 [Paratrimastix pyriformis]
MSFPVRTLQAVLPLPPNDVQIIVSVFSDRVLVAITQTGRLATLLKVQRDDRASGEVPPSLNPDASSSHHPTFDVDPLLGAPTRGHVAHVYARGVGEVVCEALGRQTVTLVSVSLKDERPEVYRRVLSTLRELLSGKPPAPGEQPHTAPAQSVTAGA